MNPHEYPFPPRGKFRGKRRHFRRLFETVATARIELAPRGLWQVWTFCPDAWAWGRKRVAYRRKQVQALYTLLARVGELKDTLPTPFEAWIRLGQKWDILVVYHPNADAPPFILRPAPRSWGIPLPPSLAGIPCPVPIRVGLEMVEDSSSKQPYPEWVVYSPGIGAPLEAASQQ